jgi:hypothetical protein
MSDRKVTPSCSLKRLKILQLHRLICHVIFIYYDARRDLCIFLLDNAQLQFFFSHDMVAENFRLRREQIGKEFMFKLNV